MYLTKLVALIPNLLLNLSREATFLATQVYAYLTNFRVNFVNQNRKCKIVERNRTNLAFYELNRVIAQKMFLFTTILLLLY